jgi:NhaP-type Na+/H+ or K+/H+ antiporter
MQLAIGMLIGASLGCSFGYVLGAIMRTGKQADIVEPSLQSARSEQIDREPELPWAA